MAETLTVYFLRHGQTSHSRDNLFCGAGSDVALTTAGEEMASCFAEAYAKEHWAGVYCSSLMRAQATAKPLCDRLGIAPQIRDGLKEIDYGEWEGGTVEDIKAKYPVDHDRWLKDPAQYAPTGGESAIQVAARVEQVLSEVQSTYTSGSVLLVSHKATIRVALCKLLGIDLAAYRFRLGCPVCSLSAVEFTKRGPLLKFLADRAHLPERLRQLDGT